MENMKDGEKSLGKMLQILETVSDAPAGIGAKELVEKLQLPRSTVFRMLKFLTGMDYMKNKGNVYVLGNMLLKMGTIAAKQNSLIRVAHPHLIELARMTKETCHLAELKDDAVVYIDKVEGNRTVRMGSMIGNRSPLHCTGIGKAILTFLKPDELAEKLAGMEFKKYTPNTIVSKKALIAELEKIRKNKVAFDREEHEAGVFCIAAPIFDCAGNVAGAVSLSGAKMYIKDNLDEYAALVKGAALSISEELGA